MHQLNEQQVVSWRNQKHSRESVFMPRAINQQCPHCGSQVTYSFRSWHRSPQKIALAKSDCPFCEDTTTFFLLEHSGSEASMNPDASLWINPRPKNHPRLFENIETESIPEPLLRTYEATINVYNAGEWTAATVLMEQLWESIIEHIMPGQSDFSKFGELKKVKHLRDLFGSFIKLAACKKTQEKLADYFSLDQAPTEETATLILECLEYMLDYLFISPEKLNQLFDKIKALSNDGIGVGSDSYEDLPPDLVIRTEESSTEK